MPTQHEFSQIRQGALRRRRWIPVLLGFGVALGLLVGMAVYGYVATLNASADRAQVTHTLEVLGQTLELENAATLMEVRHRAYLITGDPKLDERRRQSHADAVREAGALGALLVDNPGQRRRLAQVMQAVEERNSAMQMAANLATQGGIEAARADFDPFGADSIDAFRQPLSQLRAEEDRLLAAHSTASEASVRRRDQVLFYGTTLAFVLLLGAGIALLRQMRKIETAGVALGRLNAELHATLDSAGLMVVGVRPDGVIRVFNRAAQEALGYRRQEVIGQQTPMLFHVHAEVEAHAQRLSAELGENVEPGFAVFTAKADRGQLDRAEWTFVRKDGSRFPVELTVGAVTAADGERLGYIGVAMDLTERQAAERAIRALNEELTEQAEDLALTNHELESFSYSVSHDLRAPLRHIVGYARILLEDAADRLDPDSQRHLQTIASSARRMGALIDDLLALSRLGRKPVQHQPVDMRALAEDALRDVPASAGRIEIGDLPQVPGDPALLKQVWTNLLSNAVKYSAPRSDAALIRVTGETREGLARFVVRDNGVGFDMKYRDKLFGVFQRLHAQDEFEGTGVGLAIAQRIVLRHGGRIDAEGDPGSGAVFTFDLPLEERAR